MNEAINAGNTGNQNIAAGENSAENNKQARRHSEEVLAGNCEVFLSAPFWEMFGVRPRIWCAELDSGRLVPHPLIAKPADALLKSFQKIAVKTPVLKIRTPAGNQVTYDFASACEDLAGFDGKVPFYDNSTKQVSRIPFAEISDDSAYHLTDEGIVVFTTPDKKGRVKLRWSSAQEAEMRVALKMFAEIYGPELRVKDLESTINCQENPARFLAILARIARAFARVKQSGNLTHDQKTETYQLLMIAPKISAEDYFTDTKPKYLTLDRAFEVMQEYHNEPGEAPRVAWTALVKV